MITCPTCQNTNREEARFCRICGSPLTDTGQLIASQQLNQLEPGVRIHDRYQIIKKIGEGGMGRVYLATDNSGRQYALKQIREYQPGEDVDDYQIYIRSFQKEANILSSLPHPYLPIARDYISAPGSLLIVMDYIEGRTLSEVLSESPAPLPESKVLSWSIQVCEALTYLHNKKPPIIHRNIKPKNIILESGEKEHVRLIGFGLARYFVEALEKDEDNLGTHGFSPPEQYGVTQTDARSDIFGLGAMMFALLTHHDPGDFVSIKENESMEFNFPELRSLNPDLSNQTSRVVMKSLSVDPKERFQSAAEMKTELETILYRKPAEGVVDKFRLNQPISLEETRQAEFKEIKGADPEWAIKKNIEKYTVAYLNSEGGRIFWGIRDDDRVVVGVRLDYRKRDVIRRVITDKICQIQPAISPNTYHVNLHPVYDVDKIIKDLYVVEVNIEQPHTNLLYFTGGGEVFIKTDAGKKKLTGSEIHNEIIRRLQGKAGW